MTTFNSDTAKSTAFIALESDVTTPEVEHHSAVEWLYHAVHVVNSEPGDPNTVQIYVSADGVNWVQLGADITADDYIQLPGGIYRYMKAKISAGTAGKGCTVWFLRGWYASK